MKFKYSFCYVLYSPRASIWSSFYCSMTIVSIFRGGGIGNLAGWYSYFFGTIIRHTRVFIKWSSRSRIRIVLQLQERSMQCRDLIYDGRSMSTILFKISRPWILWVDLQSTLALALRSCNRIQLSIKARPRSLALASRSNSFGISVTLVWYFLYY